MERDSFGSATNGSTVGRQGEAPARVALNPSGAIEPDGCQGVAVYSFEESNESPHQNRRAFDD
jgi:hypothetical protein